MGNVPKPKIIPFAQAERYEQEEPGAAVFRWLLKKDEIEDLCIGLVTLTGPIHKTPAEHSAWDQIYLIFAGQGTIHLGDRLQQVTGPAIIVIPRDTWHSVQLQTNETITYAFINKYF